MILALGACGIPGLPSLSFWAEARAWEHGIRSRRPCDPRTAAAQRIGTTGRRRSGTGAELRRHAWLSLPCTNVEREGFRFLIRKIRWGKTSLISRAGLKEEEALLEVCTWG